MGYGGTQMCLTRKNKEKLWELGTWEHGNFEREQGHPPSPDGDSIFK